jgi:hypothetical protein
VGSENSHLEFISTTSRAVTYKKSTTCCIFPGYRHRYPSLTLRSRVAQRPLTCRMVFTSHPSLDRRTGAIQRLHTPVFVLFVTSLNRYMSENQSPLAENSPNQRTSFSPARPSATKAFSSPSRSSSVLFPSYRPTDAAPSPTVYLSLVVMTADVQCTLEGSTAFNTVAL